MRTYRGGNDDTIEQGDGDQEPHEVEVVPSPNAVPNPRAVVVELIHAVVAHGAVLGAWGPLDVARDTVLRDLPFSFLCLGVVKVR